MGQTALLNPSALMTAVAEHVREHFFNMETAQAIYVVAVTTLAFVAVAVGVLDVMELRLAVTILHQEHVLLRLGA